MSFARSALALLRHARGTRGLASTSRLASTPPSEFPDLRLFDPVLDVRPERIVKGQNYTVYLLNDDVTISSQPPESRFINPTPDGRDVIEELEKATPFTKRELLNFRRYRIVINRVSNMTSKGKQGSFYTLVVTGDGNGLVGYGEGKDIMMPRALDKAFAQAIKNMDWVNRKEDRTIWGTRSGKYGATKIELRERPPGVYSLSVLTLRTPAELGTATRVRSEDVARHPPDRRGSRDHGPLCKDPRLAEPDELCQARSAAAARWFRSHRYVSLRQSDFIASLTHRPGMGDGFGKRGKREDKGVGMRSAEEIGQTLGRRAIDRSDIVMRRLDKRRANY
jgi:small subunit ribosomal protein S5